MQQLLKFIVAMQLRAMEIREDRGATATEYALLVAFIALVVIVGVTAFGSALSGWFSSLGSTVSGWAK